MSRNLTPEEAREMGRRGAAASLATRRKKAEVRADIRARTAFEAEAERMARVIIDAALGNGDFSKLDPKERAQFALKALEYGVGRPRPADPRELDPVDAIPGLRFEVEETSTGSSRLVPTEVDNVSTENSKPQPPEVVRGVRAFSNVPVICRKGR